jgi:uncharacterized membrane protein
VIQEALPPIFNKYGDQINIIGIDASQANGQALFQAAILRYGMESGPVPTLIVGDTVLIGSKDIPEKLPGLIEKYLAMGGVGWPDIPGLTELLSAAQTAQTPTTSPPSTSTPYLSSSTPTLVSTQVEIRTPSPTATPPSLILATENDDSLKGRILRDPVGNTLSIIVLIGMVVSVIGVFFRFFRTHVAPIDQSWGWVFPMICIVGMGVAGYLAYVETTQATAICGPVGDCNTVQQSEYARLFGVIPIGVLGMLGYILILLAWMVERFARGRLSIYASLSIMGMAAFGTLFSICLTFLEPFVIGATCAWCLTSAILITTLLWLSVTPARIAFLILFQRESADSQESTPNQASETIEDKQGGNVDQEATYPQRRDS